MSESDDNRVQQMGGVGSPETTATSSQETVKETGAAAQSSAEQLDHWRMLLVDLVYHLNGALRDEHYWEGVKSDKDTIGEFVKILHELQQMPQHDNVIRIEHRGKPGMKIPEKSDYIIRFGDHRVDIAAVSALIKRLGIRVKHIEGRLIQSFEGFAARDLATLIITIPDETDESLEKMRTCMRIVSCFNKAVQDDAPIEYVKNDQKVSLDLIFNESQQPDPNLTQLAALNALSPQNMDEMIQRIVTLMQRPEFAKSGQQAANVYQAIFSIKSLRQRLIRPIIELNSERGPLSESVQKGRTAGAGSGASGPDTPPRPKGSGSAEGQCGQVCKTSLWEFS